MLFHHRMDEVTFQNKPINVTVIFLFAGSCLRKPPIANEYLLEGADGEALNTMYQVSTRKSSINQPIDVAPCFMYL